MPSDRARLFTSWNTCWNAWNSLLNEYGTVSINEIPAFPWKNGSSWGFIGIHFGILKIRTCHRMEFVWLHLERGWNAWNTFAERIWDGFNNGNLCVSWKTAVFGVLLEHTLKYSKIRTYHHIELVLVHLEPSWNASNTLPNEYATVSKMEISVFSKKTPVIRIALEYTLEYQKSKHPLG